MGNLVTVKERAGGIYTQDVLARGHKLYADEPESLGSADLGPSPFEYVLAGLGACTSITLRMYADRKGWPVTNISVDVSYKKSGFGSEIKSVFIRKITIEGELDEVQRKSMMVIADKCPVHKMLEAETEIRTELAG
ncbi:MAG: osmotically inducible protein OsmC [Robiginitomaculum sp.]|nr:MAG: osmotically inducible protein OsmC [Robiginitomaculum sp.]